VAYAMLETMRVGFQSPDRFVSGLSALCVIALLGIILHDTTQNHGEFVVGTVTSGARVGLAVNQAIIEA